MQPIWFFWQQNFSDLSVLGKGFFKKSSIFLANFCQSLRSSSSSRDLQKRKLGSLNSQQQVYRRPFFWTEIEKRRLAEIQVTMSAKQCVFYCVLFSFRRRNLIYFYHMKGILHNGFFFDYYFYLILQEMLCSTSVKLCNAYMHSSGCPRVYPMGKSLFRAYSDCQSWLKAKCNNIYAFFELALAFNHTASALP